MSLVKRKFLRSDVQSCYRGCAYIPGLWPSLRPGAKTGDISLQMIRTKRINVVNPFIVLYSPYLFEVKSMCVILTRIVDLCVQLLTLKAQWKITTFHSEV